MKKILLHLIYLLILISIFSCKPETVTDIDGNVYRTIKIGTQTWMAENLRTTHYRNGDSIYNTLDNLIWKNRKAGAQCIYKNNKDTNFIKKYGRLYNWYAVSNESFLAPQGWHIPNAKEWKTLEKYLVDHDYNFDKSNFNNRIAKSLSSTSDWELSKYKGAIGNDLSKNNLSGFNAMPAGYRSEEGYYYTKILYSQCGWWSINPDSENTNEAYMAYLFVNNDYLLVFTAKKNKGFSVRCIKDDY